MSKRTGDENASPDTHKKQTCINATNEGSSGDADSGHLFPDTESESSSTETTLDNPSEDIESMDTPDRLTSANLIKEKLGAWEVEYSYEGEGGLQEHFNNCQKNPDHRDFIPVDEFSIDNLPEGYRDKDMVDYIRAVSDLTVRVTVKYVSDRRPPTTPISEKPYPYYSDRGKRMTAVGTGWVNQVNVCKDEVGSTCSCKDCENSSTPRTTFGVIGINTATHVVFDDMEGDHTTCHLFYDRGGLPETCSGAIKLSGMFCSWSDPEIDICELMHFTHDVHLAERLAQRCQQRDELRDKIRSRPPRTWNYKRARPTPDKQPLLFIVSHPHGYSKQISIGRWTSLQTFNNKTYSYMYSTATCRGSSGAQVYLPHEFVTPHRSLELFTLRSIHSGASDIRPGFNFCHGIPVSPMFEWVSLEFMQRNEDLWENNFSCVEEEDLHKHYHTCQKNPGHQNVFPVDEFILDNLPPFYRKDEVMKFIKTVADLTVRVSVSYVSEQRPETVLGTVVQYPWYKNRGSNQLRVGCGIITEVYLFPDDACGCQECENSDTATIGFARFHIRTAAHLVYDELEGEQTTCHLFFDSGETLAACKGAVTLKNKWSVDIDQKKDMCELMYITKDLNLASRLQTLTEVYNEYVDLLEDYDFFTVSEGAEQIGRNKSTLEPPLYIVVSHPHGCAKQVSLAHCGCPGNTDTQEHQCPYKLIACPGSSGAPVISLGWEFLYPTFE